MAQFISFFFACSLRVAEEEEEESDEEDDDEDCEGTL